MLSNSLLLEQLHFLLKSFSSTVVLLDVTGFIDFSLEVTLHRFPLISLGVIRRFEDITNTINAYSLCFNSRYRTFPEPHSVVTI